MKFLAVVAFIVCSLSSALASGTLDFNLVAKDKLSSDSKVLFNKDLKLRAGQIMKISVPSWVGQATAQILTYEVSAQATYSPTSIEAVIKAIVSDVSGQNAQVVSTKQIVLKVLPKNDTKTGILTVDEGATKFNHELVISSK